MARPKGRLRPSSRAMDARRRAYGSTHPTATNRCTSSLVKQPLRRTISSPGLVRAPGSARSPLPFAPPPMRGGWRAKGACHGFRRGGPGVTGRPRARGLTHPCADASALPQRATRYRSAFAFTAAGPDRGLTPAGLPGGRPLYVAWRQRSEPRTRVPHPVPPFERLAK